MGTLSFGFQFIPFKYKFNIISAQAPFSKQDFQTMYTKLCISLFMLGHIYPRVLKTQLNAYNGQNHVGQSAILHIVLLFEIISLKTIDWGYEMSLKTNKHLI